MCAGLFFLEKETLHVNLFWEIHSFSSGINSHPGNLRLFQSLPWKLATGAVYWKPRIRTFPDNFCKIL